MFNIKRFDADNVAQTPSSPSVDRLAKLNARFKKSKATDSASPHVSEPFSTTTTTTTSSSSQKESSSASGTHQRFKDVASSRSRDSEQPIISYKRTREVEIKDSRPGKKWDKKRTKELRDEDLIPNDVRLARKAEAEAKAKAETESNDFGGLALPSFEDLEALAEDMDKENDPHPTPAVDKDKDEDMEDSTEMEDLEDVRPIMDDAALDAALADIAALVPLPTFEVKEVTAEERERAKAMGIPDWLAHPTTIDPETNTPIDSALFGLSDRLLKQCRKAGIEECFAVQTAVIPVLMRAKHLGDIRKAPGDLCVSAPTGSGKTLAYVLPIIEILSQRVVTRLRALVILPTRDLCVQVKETFESFIKGTDLKIATTTGQHSFTHEQSILVGSSTGDAAGSSKKGAFFEDAEDEMDPSSLLGGQSRVDILITTPGRLIDHVKSTPGFTLQHLRFLVIDEADRLLNQSFQEWLFHVLRAIHPSVPDPSSIPSSLSVVDRDESNEARDKNQDSKALTTKADLKRDHLGFPIHDAIAPAFLPSFFRLADSEVEDPKVLSVQKLLFSATLTRNPAKIASLQLSDPQYVAVQELGEDGEEKQKYTTPAGLTEHMIVCETSDKPLMVLHLLHHLQVRSALCFTKSVESAHRLCKLIQLYEQVRVLDTSGKEKTFSVDANDKTEKEVEDEQGSDNDDGESGSESDNGSNSDSEDEDKEAGDVEMEDADADQAKPTTTGSTDPIIVAEFSSDLPKAKRAQILRQFSAGQIHLLICSDLIARGMDLAPVENVINYDVPVYMKKYIHRVGRTARAGKSGTAYSLVEMQEARHFREMMVKAGHWDRVEKIKVRSAETQDLVPTYTTALAGLKSELSASARAKRRHGHARRPPQ